MPPSGDRAWYQPPVRRFSVVGASGMVVNNIVLVVLHGVVGIALLPATAAAVETAIAHNYVLHEFWTFRRPPEGAAARRTRLSARRFFRFNLVTAVALVLNVGVVQALAGLGVFYLLANLVGIGAGFTVNLAVSSMWIWRERTDGAHPAGGGQPGLAAVDGTGGALPLPHDLHLGPAGGGRARTRTGIPGCAGFLLHRHRSGPARGGRHPSHHRPRRTH
jgi:putative flippase GtrA